MKILCKLEIEEALIESHSRHGNAGIILNLKGGIVMFIHDNSIGIFSEQSILLKGCKDIPMLSLQLMEITSNLNTMEALSDTVN